VAQQDMFLKVEGTRSGSINGEAQDTKHKDEIDVLSWSWGMESRTDLYTTGPSRRATIKELLVIKRIDRSSTALMSALTTNEPIKQALLTVRKAGKTPLEYLKITIKKARLTSIHHRTDPSDPAQLAEELSFSFQNVTVDYTPQGSDGQPRGATTFTSDWGASAEAGS
jgi:type VI secretion system secreted protein Hcp